MITNNTGKCATCVKRAFLKTYMSNIHLMHDKRMNRVMHDLRMFYARQVMYVRRAYCETYFYQNLRSTYVSRKANLMHGL